MAIPLYFRGLSIAGHWSILQTLSKETESNKLKKAKPEVHYYYTTSCRLCIIEIPMETRIIPRSLNSLDIKVPTANVVEINRK